MWRTTNDDQNVCLFSIRHGLTLPSLGHLTDLRCATVPLSPSRIVASGVLAMGRIADDVVIPAFVTVEP